MNLRRRCHASAIRDFIRPVDIVLTGVLLLGLTAWATAILFLPADYDEVYHAHAIWLIRQGDRPFHDFLAVHTPFLWYAVSPFLRWLPDSPQMLLPLRLSTGVGVLIWLAALIANFRYRQSHLSPRWMLTALGLVLFSTPVLAYAVEFRPDAWAFALYFCALYRHRTQQSASSGVCHYALFGCLASFASVACLKVAPFAAVFVLFELLRLVRRGPELLVALSGYLVGAGATLVISWLFLEWAKLDVRMVIQFAYRFQTLFEKNTGFSHGLLWSLIENPLPLFVAVGGLVAWGWQSYKTRTVPDALQAGIVAVLVWELFEVHRPYKQYYGPWYLMAAPFFAYVKPLCSLRGRRDQFQLAFLLILGGVAAVASIGRLRGNQLGLSIQRLQIEIMARSHPTSAIIAAPPFHPIVRRDVFYAWSRTTDPRGYTTEPAMSDLGLGDLVSAKRYRDELGRRDPSVIVLPLTDGELYEPLQWQIISEFLRRKADHFEVKSENLIRPIAVKRASPTTQ